MTTRFTCILCGGKRGKSVFADCADYYLGKAYRASYSRCEGCGLMQQSPLPRDTAPFYDAYPVHQRKSALHRMMRRWVMGACYFSGGSAGWQGREAPVLVDFGCGDGWFLDAHRRSGFDLVGFEPDREHAERLAAALGAPVYSDERALVQDYRGRADVVTMHFVLEHLVNPNRAFEVVRELLAPRGVFYFVIPEIDSWEARLFGRRWHNLDAPRHISFPESSAIRQLSSRWGLEFVKCVHVPFPNGVAGSIPVVLTGRFRFALFAMFLPLGIILSRLFPGGASAYWLKKPAARSSDSADVN